MPIIRSHPSYADDFQFERKRTNRPVPIGRENVWYRG
jgi:hypothetical protein